MKALRQIPSVDQVLRSPGAETLVERFGSRLSVQTIREVLEDIRNDVIPGIPEVDELLSVAGERMEKVTRSGLQPVINATGVVLHTNLGRAPLSPEAIAAMEVASTSYSTLEYDLEQGTRGSRQVHCEQLLRKVTGAEAAIVVNNNASAVLLVLAGLFKGKQVAISRSEMVEIGGSFRVPDVMRFSGARLMEVGTTNKTRAADFEEAIQAGAAAILHVHTSNFKIIGFTEEVGIRDLAELGARYGIPVIDDLGSGCLLDTTDYSMGHEPTVQESLQAGADIVTFSGDKLLGGPQAGIILGKRELVAKLKRHPLARAIRADKVCLAGLSATLLHYLKGEAETQVPVWRMISQPADTIRQRALFWLDRLKYGEVIEGRSTVGGGSLPGETLPTWLLSLDLRSPDKALAVLRKGTPHVIARISGDKVVLDPRTVFEQQEDSLLSAVAGILQVFGKGK